jgi:uncharacterized protein (TIGR02246 family)
MAMVKNPEDMPATFERLFNAGDLNGLVDLYEGKALFVDGDGNEHRGPAAIRGVLQGFLTGNPRITLYGVYCRTMGDLALARVQWTLTGKDEKGQKTEVVGLSSELMRRQGDGAWKFAIDLPVGGQS